MNIHYLELFYYVARYGGIMEAVRNMPYGIQQPAVSAQILQLEDSLGVTLFHRRPFALTPPGEKLYQFIQPFFGNLPAMEEEIRGGMAQQIRVGASEIVLREHLPAVFASLGKKFPALKLVLREGHQPQSEKWLQQQEIDVALTVMERQPPPGMGSLALLQLPLVLLVSQKSRLRSAEELWQQDKIAETLLCLPPTEIICKHFQQELSRRRVDWYPGIELSSLQLIETYVEKGYGIGLSVMVPQGRLSPKLRRLPLEGFAPVNFGLLWQGKPSPLLAAFIETVKAYAAALG